MSTDRELLEAAARAAGIDSIRWHSEFLGGWILIQDGRPISGQPWWNPLRDDGDAMRLAVKLRLDVNIVQQDALYIRASNYETGVFAQEPLGAGPYAATRRAIVRAAAALADKQ